MAKSMIINRFSGKNNVVYLPCDDTQATSFATDFLDGEYQVLKAGTVSGSDVVTSYYEVGCMVKNTTSGVKAYMNMLVLPTKTEEDIFNSLIGLTINEVLVDEVFIMSMKKVIL
jgi:TctA family transporter